MLQKLQHDLQLVFQAVRTDSECWTTDDTYCNPSGCHLERCKDHHSCMNSPEPCCKPLSSLLPSRKNHWMREFRRVVVAPSHSGFPLPLGDTHTYSSHQVVPDTFLLSGTADGCKPPQSPPSLGCSLPGQEGRGAWVTDRGHREVISSTKTSPWCYDEFILKKWYLLIYICSYNCIQFTEETYGMNSTVHGECSSRQAMQCSTLPDDESGHLPTHVWRSELCV